MTYEDVGWIHLARVKVRWQAVANIVVNFEFRKGRGTS